MGVGALAAVSFVALALEVFLSRLVSYSVHVILLYAVLGVAMLGFGAAGSLVAARHDWLEPARLPRALAWASLSFAGTLVAAYAGFTRLTPYLQQVDVAAIGAATVLTLPFLAAATVITLSLTAAGARVGLAYAANLVGSGLGCFLPLVLLGPLDGEHFLGLLAVLAWCSHFPYLRRAGARPGSALGVASFTVLALAVASFAFARGVFPIQPEPEPTGQLAWHQRNAEEHGVIVVKRFDRWNPTGRIEILEFHGVGGEPGAHPVMFYAQDSTAGSSLLRWDGRDRTQARARDEDSGVVPRLCSETVYGQGYFRQRNKVLVVGLGGGPDVQCALYHEAQQVDVVEINPDSIAAIRGPFDEYTGGIGSHPRVRYHERDGRSFVHSQRARGYDLIQLTGVDTKQHYASSSLALSENHLYTLEAFRDYMRALAPGGVVSIIRFGEAETLRLAQTASVVLRELQADHPERHMIVLASGAMGGVIIARQPLTASDASALRAKLHPPHFRGARLYSFGGFVPFETPVQFLYDPFVETPGTVDSFFKHMGRGADAEFASRYTFNITPVTDERPFFFDTVRYDLPWASSAFHVVALRNLLLSMLALSVLLILWPLRHLRERVRGLAAFTNPTFFAAIGVGYVLLQVWMLHTFAMFLGHQVYSLSIVLATLLISTGAGAALGSLWFPDPRRRLVAGTLAITVILGIGLAALPPVMEALWDASIFWRAAVTIAFVAPAGMALGLPFVGGLLRLKETAPGSVPWGIGINGFASVVAFVGAIPLSMGFGYDAVIAVGGALYLLSGAIALGWKKRI